MTLLDIPSSSSLVIGAILTLQEPCSVDQRREESEYLPDILREVGTESDGSIPRHLCAQRRGAFMT